MHLKDMNERDIEIFKPLKHPHAACNYDNKLKKNLVHNRDSRSSEAAEIPTDQNLDTSNSRKQ